MDPARMYLESHRYESEHNPAMLYAETRNVSRHPERFVALMRVRSTEWLTDIITKPWLDADNKKIVQYLIFAKLAKRVNLIMVEEINPYTNPGFPKALYQFNQAVLRSTESYQADEIDEEFRDLLAVAHDPEKLHLGRLIDGIRKLTCRVGKLISDSAENRADRLQKRYLLAFRNSIKENNFQDRDLILRVERAIDGLYWGYSNDFFSGKPKSLSPSSFETVSVLPKLRLEACLSEASQNSTFKSSLFGTLLSLSDKILEYVEKNKILTPPTW